MIFLNFKCLVIKKLFSIFKKINKKYLYISDRPITYKQVKNICLAEWRKLK